ncbi:hypothetical protein SCUCBS95973_003060 [Sporothrix curviconia]|uniref:Autophagy-related protein 33 n=1 Tax=Sporothrix curviconia TaxID=1260050 RepID=A0ABP0BC57_9PEZI
MSFRGVAVLKFVGTVSLGLLTGLSFSLSTVTVPTLLTLPSARTASNAFRSLTDAASAQLRILSGVASSAFLLAYLFSPRHVRHPYLMHTSMLVIVGRFLTSDTVAPYLFSPASSSSSGSSPGASSDPFSHSSPLGKSLRRSGSASSSHAHMEASYEVLGSTTAGSVSGGSVSDSHSDGGAGSDETEAAAGGNAAVNGEEVRASVETFLKRQIARTVVSGVAFAVAIVGLWGDGARRVPVWREAFVVV